MRAGYRRLDDDREAELLGCGDGLVGIGGEALGDEREAVGEQELARVGRAQPDIVVVRERPLDDALGGIAVDALEDGDGAVRLPEPLRPLGQAPERPRRRLRVVERGDMRPSRRSASGMPLALSTTASTGFSLVAALGGRPSIASATSSAVAVTVGTKSTITASTCGSSSRSGSAAA